MSVDEELGVSEVPLQSFLNVDLYGLDFGQLQAAVDVMLELRRKIPAKWQEFCFENGLNFPEGGLFRLKAYMDEFFCEERMKRVKSLEVEAIFFDSSEGGVRGVVEGPSRLRKEDLCLSAGLPRFFLKIADFPESDVLEELAFCLCEEERLRDRFDVLANSRLIEIFKKKHPLVLNVSAGNFVFEGGNIVVDRLSLTFPSNSIEGAKRCASELGGRCKGSVVSLSDFQFSVADLVNGGVGDVVSETGGGLRAAAALN